MDWNRSDPNAALRLWLHTDPLNLFQAVMLSLGRAPNHELTGRPDGYVPMMSAVVQAIERGKLPVERTRVEHSIYARDSAPLYPLDYADKTFVRQADMRKWLREIGHPNALFFLVDPAEWPPQDSAPKIAKPMDARERTTMLRIIRALDVMANLPSRGATVAVEKQLQELGFTGPKEATIRSILDEARKLEPDR